MPDIHILDEQTIDQIAAGEVIERPASVVKELVENALDAGADDISVELKGGGLELIRVRDNGCGIPSEQVRLAFFRHATSKIRQAQDLFSICSLGFRGEALSSIASVTRVELITRTAEAQQGLRYVIEGGRELAEEPCDAPAGTCFSIRDLFYNTPVRRKFLRSPQTETAYVLTLMEQLALSRPGVAMSLTAEGRLRLQTGSRYSLKEIIYTLFGREMAAHMREVAHETTDMSVRGFVAEPIMNRGNRSGELFFVNGRPVKHPVLMKALEQACHGLTMQHKFPAAVLLITLDPSQVDVNVHPQKTEIRFRSDKEVFDLVYKGVRQALFARDLIPSQYAGAVPLDEPLQIQEAARYPREEPAAPAPVTAPPIREAAPPQTVAAVSESDREKAPVPVAPVAAVVRPLEQAPAKPREEAVQQNLFQEKIISPEKKDRIRLIGQVFDTYWLLEYEEWFLLADQHAVHEKILYERTMKSLEKREATSQQLMPPLILTLNGAQQESLSRFGEAFHRLGFEMESLGGRELRLNAVPDNLFSLSSRELFLEMLDELSEERVTAPSLLDAKVALMSCKAAVKGNDRLDFAEARALFEELLSLENPYTCPHGRPTLIRFSRAELEKMFKRTL